MQAVVLRKQTKLKPAYRGVAMVTINLSYPQVLTRENPPVGEKISGYYREAEGALYLHATRELYAQAVAEYRDSRKNGFPFRPYTAMSVYEVPYNQNDLLSITTDYYEYTGGAHGTTVRSAETWSLETGRRMALSDFFRGSGYKSILFDELLMQTASRIADGSGSFFDDYRKNIFQYLDERNYYLTPEGFAVYFPLITIAPYSSGIVTYVIPYGTFGREMIRPL